MAYGQVYYTALNRFCKTDSSAPSRGRFPTGACVARAVSLKNSYYGDENYELLTPIGFPGV